MKKNETINSANGSIGNVLLDRSQKLSTISDKEVLVNFLKSEVSPKVDPRFQEDMTTLISTVEKQKSFFRAYRYVYNYILAGDGLRAE